MRYSQNFAKTLKQAPKDEVAINAQLLIRAGFIYKVMAGVYAFLPLGLKVLENLKGIVREEMNLIGGKELIMTSLQRRELWEKTDRWDDQKVDVWFKSKLKNETEVGFGWSHEEQITDMMTNYINSYRDLPVYVYQFQNKLRNELRAKSGIMRGREFLMKDMYSYTTSAEEHQKFYDSVTKAYLNIFKKVGLGDDTYLTFASGGAFTQFSHEFQTLSEVGEDTIFVHKQKKIAINKEVMTDEVLKKLDIKRDELEETRAVETGNIFDFGTTKTEQLGLYFSDEKGIKKPVHLGSYGIGITRLMGILVEKFHDDKGIIWPKEVAPFQVHLIDINSSEKGEAVYKKLVQENIEVLWDDRDVRAGEKFADCDLIGIPVRLVVSEKNGDKIEWKNRNSEETELLTIDEVVEKLQN